MSESTERVGPIEDGGTEDPERVLQAALSSRDRRILDFEREWKRHGEAKEDAVQSEFGLTYARYYQVLNTIIDSPAALTYDPMLITRLQRMRETTTRARVLLPHPSDNNPGSR
ncbi:MAG: DUF3263 domain-containing protein [Terrimesophilobacter sp.]